MDDDSGILEEIKAEHEELQKILSTVKDYQRVEIVLNSSPFFSLEEKGGKLLITGIALAEGVWKNVLYPADEIAKSAEDLKGKPLMVEHGLDSHFEKIEVGKVLAAYYDKTLKSIVFQAEVDNVEAISLVKDGTFPAVSCSTWVDKFPVNQDQSIGFNFNFQELSLVRTPACFLSDTMIFLNPHCIPIQDDAHSFGRYYSGKVFQIKARYCPLVNITKDHFVLSARRVPKTYSQDKISWDKGETGFRKIEELETGDFLVLHKSKKGDLDLNLDLLRVIAWYITEGCSSIKKGTVEFNLSRTETLHQEELLNALSNLGYKAKVREMGSVSRIMVYSSKLARQLYPCGHRATEKKIPEEIFRSKNILFFLKELWKGDGCVGKINDEYVTVSKQLAYQVWMLLKKTGRLSTIHSEPPKSWSIEGRSGITHEKFSVSYRKRSTSKRYCLEDENYFYVPIIRKTSFDYSGPVYDLLETPGHQYEVPFIVHNCDKCFIFAVEELSKKMTSEKEPLNNPSTSNKVEEVKDMKDEDVDEEEEVIDELDEEEEDLSEIEQPKLYAVVEVDTLADLGENLAKAVSYYYGYGYPYGYKGKYPYPQYPYYPYYPYGYPEKQAKKYPYYEKYKYPQKKSLWALLQLESPEEIEALKKAGKKVAAVYYGYYGYPYGKKGYPYKYKHPEKKAEEYKCPEGQVWDEKTGKCIEKLAKKEGYTCPEGQVWDEKEKKCVEAKEQMSDEEELLEDLAIPKDYLAFMKKCMKESKTMPVIKRMKECAKAYKASLEKKAVSPQECPKDQVWDEKQAKCVPVEGQKTYPAPAPLQNVSAEFTDTPKETEMVHKPAPIGFEAQAIAIKLGETVNKEETLSAPKVEIPMAKEEPCKDCPKKEENSIPKVEKPKPVVVEVPKEETKIEPPKVEVPKVETPPVEASKVEVPKVETPKVEKIPEVPKEIPKEEPKVEVPKVEPKKEPSPEEVQKFVKQHYPEILLELIKKERKK